MLDEAGMTDYRKLVSTSKGLKVLTKWAMKLIMLLQFLLAAENLTNDGGILYRYRACKQTGQSGRAPAHRASAAHGGLLPCKVSSVNR